MLKPCVTFEGVVAYVAHMADGDWHVDISPSPGFARYLSPHAEVPGTLVTEIIPAHPLRVPRIGERVRILGTWVVDALHRWNEIHPVWTIRRIH